ncbi:VOC family protein [Nocardioides sp. MAHUQ-72]|uniref:VOC family protein n=1 Tax=unclassified Nocardioides TaxID=2615069 RepID=UPI0036239129
MTCDPTHAESDPASCRPGLHPGARPADLRRLVRRTAGRRARDGVHGGTILDISTEGETRLALDATVRHLRALDVPLTSDIEDIGSVSFVQFEDPDGNPLMVCRRN